MPTRVSRGAGGAGMNTSQDGSCFTALAVAKLIVQLDAASPGLPVAGNTRSFFSVCAFILRTADLCDRMFDRHELCWNNGIPED